MRVVGDHRVLGDGRRRVDGAAGGDEAGGAQGVVGGATQAGAAGAVEDLDADLLGRHVHRRRRLLPALPRLGVLDAVGGARDGVDGAVLAQGVEELAGRGVVPAHGRADVRHGEVGDGDRHRGELRGGRGEGAHRLAEVEEVGGAEAPVGPDRAAHRGGDLLELHRVQQHPAVGRLVHERGEESLLPLHPAQVGGAVEVAGAYVLQGPAAVEGAGAGRQVEPGVGVPERPHGAHLDAADRVDGLHEAGEVDLHVVIDVDAGEALDGAYGQRGAALGVGGVELLRVGRAHPAGLVRALGDLGVGVPRQSDDGGALAVGGEVHEHHRVGAVAGGAAQAVAPALVLADLVPAVGADEQDVHAASEVRPVGQPAEGVHPTDAAGEAGDHRVPDAARAQHGHRGSRGQPHPPARAAAGRGVPVPGRTAGGAGRCGHCGTSATIGQKDREGGEGRGKAEDDADTR